MALVENKKKAAMWTTAVGVCGLLALFGTNPKAILDWHTEKDSQITQLQSNQERIEDTQRQIVDWQKAAKERQIKDDYDHLIQACLDANREFTYKQCARRVRTQP